MATTYNNLYLDIRQQLRRAGIEEATLEARELVCFGTNKSREELARDGGLYASPELEHRVRDLVRRHLEGEPVAYLIGEWEFYGLPLDISRDVLIPRPDTEVLAEQAIGYIKTLGECRVLDLCAGSGCIGLAVAAQVPQARVVLGEWSDGALKICRQNVRRNSLTARVVPMQRVPTDCALLVFAVCCITACEACRLTGKKAQNAVPANKKPLSGLQTAAKCGNITLGYHITKRSDGESRRCLHGKERSFTG